MGYSGGDGLPDVHCFTVQMVDGDDGRLPTASTCFNTLKLPLYSSAAVLGAQLRKALTEGAKGFEETG